MKNFKKLSLLLLALTASFASHTCAFRFTAAAQNYMGTLRLMAKARMIALLIPVKRHFSYSKPTKLIGLFSGFSKIKAHLKAFFPLPSTIKSRSWATNEQTGRKGWEPESAFLATDGAFKLSNIQLSQLADTKSVSFVKQHADGSTETIGHIFYTLPHKKRVERQIELTSVAIFSDQDKGKGYGKMMLFYFEQFVKNEYPHITSLRLQSLRSAEPFYAKCGWDVVDHREWTSCLKEFTKKI